MGKQTVYKIEYFFSILLMISVMMHSVACVWLYIG